MRKEGAVGPESIKVPVLRAEQDAATGLPESLLDPLGASTVRAGLVSDTPPAKVATVGYRNSRFLHRALPSGEDPFNQNVEQ